MSYIFRLYVYFKLLLRKPAFLAVLIAMPIVTLAVSSISKSKDSVIHVGVYSSCVEGDLLVDSLLKDNNSVQFVRYDDKEKLREDVDFRRLECGYLFEDSFAEGMRTLKLNDSIGCIVAPSSVLYKVVNELVFANMLENVSPALASKYLEEKEIEGNLDMEYNKYVDSDSAFSVKIENVASNNNSNALHLSFMNVLSLFALLGVVLVTMVAANLRARGINIFSYGLILCGSVMLCVMVVISGAVCGEFTTNRLWLVCVYSLALSGIGYCLLQVRSEAVLCGLLPMLTIAVLLLGGVVLDIGEYVEKLKTLTKLFPTSYFANGDLKGLAIYAVAVNIIGILLENMIYGKGIFKQKIRVGTGKH